MMSIKIILADDHNIIRAGLRAMLEKQPDIKVIAEAENGRETVELARDLSPDVILMDIGMPELNGVEATRQICSESPNVKVLALSVHSDKQFVISMLKAGASGYLLKNCVFNELHRAIKTIVAGQTYLSPLITELVLSEIKDDGQSPKKSSTSTSLTVREREVLQLFSEGNSTKQIAAKLHVSISTIESHRRGIMEKLGLHSIAELTKYAIKEGLTSLEY